MIKSTLITVIIILNSFYLISCMGSNSLLEKALEEKYHEKFIVREDSYHLELGVNVFKASPKKYPDLVFEGRQKDNELLLDYYTEVLWNYEGELLLKSKLDKVNIPYHINCGVTTYNGFDSNKNLLHLKELLSSSDTTLEVQNIIYLFEDIDPSNKERLLKSIKEIASDFNKFNNKKIRLAIYFWDKSFTKGKNFKDMIFTLNVDEWVEEGYKGHGYKNDDNTENKIKFIKHKLDITYTTPVNYSFNMNQLYSLIQEYDISDVTGYVVLKDGSVKLE